MQKAWRHPRLIDGASIETLSSPRPKIRRSQPISVGDRGADRLGSYFQHFANAVSHGLKFLAQRVADQVERCGLDPHRRRRDTATLRTSDPHLAGAGAQFEIAGRIQHRRSVPLDDPDHIAVAGGSDCQHHIIDLRLIGDRDRQTRPTPHRGPADRDLELNLTIEDSGYRRGAEIFETRFSRRRCRG